jgi:hypothetical protein
LGTKLGCTAVHGAPPGPILSSRSCPYPLLNRGSGAQRCRDRKATLGPRTAHCRRRRRRRRRRRGTARLQLSVPLLRRRRCRALWANAAGPAMSARPAGRRAAMPGRRRGSAGALRTRARWRGGGRGVAWRCSAGRRCQFY